MDFSALVRRYGVLFSFYGVTPFSLPVESVQGRKMNFVDIVPTVFYSVLIIGLVCATIGYRLRSANFPNEITISSVLACIRISSEFSLHFAIIGQAIVFRQRMKKLCCAYNVIQKYMKTRMSYDVDFNAFRKELYQLIVTVFVPHLAAFVKREDFYTKPSSTHTHLPFHTYCRRWRNYMLSFT